MALAAITGTSLVMIPYASQSATPRQKIENMLSERPLADRSFQVFRTCGKKAMVVQPPANSPNNCIEFIVMLVHDKSSETLSFSVVYVSKFAVLEIYNDCVIRTQKAPPENGRQ
jgi:hypothetical protein